MASTQTTFLSFMFHNTSGSKPPPSGTSRSSEDAELVRRCNAGDESAFEAIVDGTSAGTPGADLLGRPASRHEFAEFTVLRPLEVS